MINISLKKLLKTAAFGCLFALLLPIITNQAGVFAQNELPSSGLQQQDPWTAADLLAPADLARSIETGAKNEMPLILSVGPAALIKGSVDIGPASEKAPLQKLKQTLQNQPRDKEIVIYCGCCPFSHCPNVRPAFKLLKEMHFTKAKLLNLQHNIRTDWMDKGYPTKQ